VALAIDASTPAIAVSTNNGITTVTSASFTPPAGSLLYIRWAWNTGAANTPAAPSITDNLGTPLTYTLLDHHSRADSPAVDGQCAQWSAAVGTSAAMTVTATAGTGTTVHGGALHITVLTGQHATPIGAHGKSSSTSAASIAQSYTAQATSGWGFIGVTDWDLKGTQTAGTGCTLTNSGNAGTEISYGFVRRTTADDSNGSSNTLNVTLPGTSTALSWVYAEIVPAATPASTLPQTSPRRRLAFPRIARTRATWPVGPQLNPPMPIQEIDQPRRIRGLLPRRGRTVSPVPPQVNPPYPIAETAQPRRLRGLLQRRARPAQPVPAQPAVTPPAYVPQLSRAPGRRVLFQRRGRAAAVVPPQQTVIPPAWPPPPTRARIRSLGLRRARSASVPAVNDLPPPTRPARRLWLPRPRRSTPRTPDVTAAPVAPKFIPPATRRRPFAWLRRRPLQSPPLAGPATAQVRDLVLTVGQPVPKWTAGPPTTRWRTDDPRTRWTTTTPTTRWATKDPAINTTAGPPRT
jgi:hypothetical protein